MEKDTILAHIFDDEDDAATIAPGPELKRSNEAIIAAVKQLNVPKVSAREKEEIKNHGSVELRERSEAYCALLSRRPELGRDHHLTTERFQAVIAKDRRYDALLHNAREAHRKVRVGLAHVEVRLSDAVATVLSFASEQIAATRSARLRALFLPIGSRLDELTEERARPKSTGAEE